MDLSSHELPPCKRFKLLHRQTEELHPERRPTAATTASYCLPAKKRVWAPYPLSPVKDVDTKPNDKRDEEAEAAAPDVVDDDDGIVCAVCRSTDGDPLNPIVFCDGCDLTVHAACYGNPLVRAVPEGDWFCSRCSSEEADADCCLCPAKRGAVKPTTDGRWAHIVCALLVPEVFFEDPDGRDGIDRSRVPAGRTEKVCYVCRKTVGCAIECSEPKCELGFHASCGLEEGLCIEFKEGKRGGIVAGFCKAHTELWEKQQGTGKFKIVPREAQPKRKGRTA